MRTIILQFIRDESAATAIEAGFITAAFVFATLAVVQTVGLYLNTTITSVQDVLQITPELGFTVRRTPD
jgi:Flp pilus assembly pilin Flp